MARHSNKPYLWQDPKYKTFYAIWQENGKTRRQALRPANTTRGTKDRKVAKRLLIQFTRDLFSGKVRPLHKETDYEITFFEFCEEFIAHKEGEQLSDDTIRLYNDALEKAKLVIRDIPVKRITARMLDKVVETMSRAGLVAPSVNKNLRHLKPAIKKAIKWKYLAGFDLEDDFPGFLDEKKKDRYLTIDQLRQLFEVITDPEFADLVSVKMYTGLRISEILRLKITDIDAPDGWLRVADPKNKEDDVAPINERQLRPVLERCARRAQVRTGKRFKHRRGFLFRWGCRTHVSQLFKARVRDAGLPDHIRLHDVRHTYASHQIMEGVSPKKVQKMMRHKSFASTEIYIHLRDQDVKDANEGLDYGPMPVGKKE